MGNWKLVGIASFSVNVSLFCANKKATLKEGEIDDGFNLDDEVSSVVVVSCVLSTSQSISSVCRSFSHWKYLLCSTIKAKIFLFQILNLRFSKDLRVQEIRRLLQSSKPVTVNVVQKPEVRYVSSLLAICLHAILPLFDRPCDWNIVLWPISTLSCARSLIGCYFGANTLIRAMTNQKRRLHSSPWCCVIIDFFFSGWTQGRTYVRLPVLGGKCCSWASENRSLVAQWTRKVASEDLWVWMES